MGLSFLLSSILVYGSVFVVLMLPEEGGGDGGSEE
jgi:hypothetical protein